MTKNTAKFCTIFDFSIPNMYEYEIDARLNINISSFDGISFTASNSQIPPAIFISTYIAERMKYSHKRLSMCTTYFVIRGRNFLSIGV